MRTTRLPLILAGTVAGLSLMTSTVLAQSTSPSPRAVTTSASPSASATPSGAATSPTGAATVPVAPPAIPPIPLTPMTFTQGAGLNVDTGTSQGVRQLSLMRYAGA